MRDFALLVTGVALGVLLQRSADGWLAGSDATAVRRLQPREDDAPAAEPGSTSAVHVTPTDLYATLHLAHLDGEGAIAVPSGTKRMLVEIGCSDRDTMDVDELKKASLSDAFLIAFEPLLDKYATLYARANERFNGRGVTDRAWPLGHHHPRGVVLPFAVAPHAPSHAPHHTHARGTSRARGNARAAALDGLQTFNVSRIAGCSSLVPFNENTTWGAQCFTPRLHGGVMEPRHVPVFGIQQALRLAPAHLPIEKLKLDAQGLDFKILHAAGTEALRRVVSVELEVVRASPHARML
jgi:hypothetical protein